jgi:hypothetical protein
MMQRSFYFIEPEVAGGLGERSVLNRSTHPPEVTRLHYEFDGWPDDGLLESFPCFIVNEDARHKIEGAKLTGVRFDQVETSMSDDYVERHSSRDLPQFVWLRVEGMAGQNDFGLAPDGRLVISEKALDVLQSVGISNALITKV